VPLEFLKRHLGGASEAWRRRAHDKADRMLAAWKRNAPEVGRYDAGHAAQLSWELDQDTAPCARLVELKDLVALDPGYMVKLPPRCRAPAKAPPPSVSRRRERR
jgi:hypothetical protein